MKKTKEKEVIVKPFKEKQAKVKPFKEKKKGKKCKVSNIIYWIIMGLGLVCLVLYFVLGWNKTCSDINYYLDAVIKTVLIFILANILQKLSSLIISVIHASSQRGKTVAALLKSIIKYCIAIATIIAIMVFFLGKNYIKELFTGLGVVALIVGLGCQTLISDIVAGIFMVFEGNFEVGDVVVINGWRGTVIEIGLRTTVIEDVGGNKKIVNNSGISEIINNSQALSVASCVVGIEYDESIEHVESVISANIDEMRSKIPAIVEGPFYKGVEELGGSSVNIKIVAKCKEDDKFQVQRDMNREIKLIFDKNKIGIPFPQVTLSYREETEYKVTAKDKRNSREFIEGQKSDTAFDTDNEM